MLEQAKQDVTALGPAEIEAERALAAVDPDEIGGVAAVIERRPPVAHLVALGRLDLDDLGAMVAQDLGGVRSAQDPGHVDHRDARKRAGWFPCVSAPRQGYRSCRRQVVLVDCTWSAS